MTIRKSILTICFLTIISALFGQTKEFKFLPKWKPNETKTISITQKETEYKAGKLVEDTTTYLTADVAVLSENNEQYILQIRYENIALRSAKIFYDRLGDELTGYKNLVLQYKVSKQTGKAALINWKEAQAFMNQSFKQIDSLLKKKVPEMASMAKFAFAPIKEMFKSKANIESYMTDEIGYLFFPYDKKFVSGDTLTITNSCANPLSPKDTISQTTVAYLSNIDESKNSCDIHSKDILDLTEFKKMMTQLMESMGKSFGAADSSKVKAAEQINSIDFDITNETIIRFDYKSTWPTQIIKSSKVIATDPRGKTEKTVVSTVLIK